MNETPVNDDFNDISFKHASNSPSIVVCIVRHCKLVDRSAIKQDHTRFAFDGSRELVLVHPSIHGCATNAKLLCNLLTGVVLFADRVRPPLCQRSCPAFRMIFRGSAPVVPAMDADLFVTDFAFVLCLVLFDPLRDLVLGHPGVPVEPYDVFVTDAMRMAVEVAGHESAYGRRWIVPGSGPISGKAIQQIVSEHLGRQVKLRAAGPFLLRLISFFNKNLRDFMPMVPHYIKPISYDGSRLRELLGEVRITPYEQAIGETIDWLRSGHFSTNSG